MRALSASTTAPAAASSAARSLADLSAAFLLGFQSLGRLGALHGKHLLVLGRRFGDHMGLPLRLLRRERRRPCSPSLSTAGAATGAAGVS